MFTPEERRYVERAALARLATSDGEGRPSVVPVCFALDDGDVVTAIDEKPQDVDPAELRRVRDVAADPRVALVVDHYAAEWSDLGWVQIRGTATLVDPDHEFHADGVAALRAKYDQYADHDLESRPQLRINPGSVRSWGRLERPDSDRAP